MDEDTAVKVVNDVINDSGFNGLSKEIQDNMKTLLVHLKGMVTEPAECMGSKMTEDQPIKPELPEVNLVHLKGMDSDENAESTEKNVEKKEEKIDTTFDTASLDYNITNVLLSGEGFNHSSFTRKLKGNDSPKSKEETRNTYNSTLEYLNIRGVIHKQGHDWFWIKGVDTKHLTDNKE